MKWDQIETKWAAMTRRIRADYDADRIDPTGRHPRGLQGHDSLSATIAESLTASVNDTERKSSAK